MNRFTYPWQSKLHGSYCYYLHFTGEHKRSGRVSRPSQGRGQGSTVGYLSQGPLSSAAMLHHLSVLALRDKWDGGSARNNVSSPFCHVSSQVPGTEIFCLQNSISIHCWIMRRPSPPPIHHTHTTHSHQGWIRVSDLQVTLKASRFTPVGSRQGVAAYIHSLSRVQRSLTYHQVTFST